MNRIYIFVWLSLLIGCNTNHLGDASNRGSREGFVSQINKNIESLSFLELNRAIYEVELSRRDSILIPRLIEFEFPRYPISAEEQLLKGDVNLAIIIDDEGNVINVRVQSSTNKIFEEPAKKSLYTWRFSPAKVNGESVKFGMVMPVRFRL